MDYIRYWSDGYQLGGGVRYCIDLTGPKMKLGLLMDLATLEHKRVDLKEIQKYGTVIELTEQEARRIARRLAKKMKARSDYRKDYVEKAHQWLKTKARGRVLRNRDLPKGHMDDKKETHSQLPA